MQKRVVKVISLLIISLLVLSMVSVVFGAGDYKETMRDLIDTMDTAPGETNATKTATSIVTNLIIIFRIVGVTAAILMLLVVAMKYMTSAPSEKAEIKKSAVVYIVGAVILFAVTGILGIISNLSSTINVTN
jgi:hypothetical protein